MLAFLDERRTWPELKRWARANKIDEHFLRHQLAWLEDRKLAASKPLKKKGAWIWFNANATAMTKPKRGKKQKKLGTASAAKRLARMALRKKARSKKKIV